MAGPAAAAPAAGSQSITGAPIMTAKTGQGGMMDHQTGA